MNIYIHCACHTQISPGASVAAGVPGNSAPSVLVLRIREGSPQPAELWIKNSPRPGRLPGVSAFRPWLRAALQLVLSGWLRKVFCVLGESPVGPGRGSAWLPLSPPPSSNFFLLCWFIFESAFQWQFPRSVAPPLAASSSARCSVRLPGAREVLPPWPVAGSRAPFTPGRSGLSF